jgi:pyruvate kinase
LIRELQRMREEILRLERRQPFPSFGEGRSSARNLVDYLAFRRFDARELQEQLARLGLSSLGRAESHVRGNLDSVLRQLYALSGRKVPRHPPLAAFGPDRGRELIDRRARALLGRPRPGRRARIMVTAPTEAATDPSFVRKLLDAGMDCMRINCAHDSAPIWSAMIANLRTAERPTERRCHVEIDLCGPRVRIGPMAPAPPVVKVRPQRDEFGRVRQPGALWLLAAGTRGRPTDERVPGVEVPAGWLSRRRRGGTIVLSDARGAHRTLRVIRLRRGARLVTCSKTVYLADGTRLRGRPTSRSGRDDAVVTVPPRPGSAFLRADESVLLTSGSSLGRAEVRDRSGRLRVPAAFAVLPPEVLPSLRVGERVWFDGGRVGGVVAATRPGQARVRITHARPQGSRLGADKGLNLPDTALNLPSLTAKDLEDLDFAIAHADLIGYSFVQSAADVRALRHALAQRGVPDFEFVLKIETARAFELLPEILLAALHAPVAGVMIARGDLAVEVGYERLAEVQEEILWLCEAAHLPVIWATQVLEGLTKTGLPSRAEVTDAAMGARAECVMLNKGPHLVEAVKALDNILQRMEAHQQKKSARLRHLNVAEHFFEPSNGERGTAGAAVVALGPK